MVKQTQWDRAYWDGLQLIASNIEFIVSDGPQPWQQGRGLFHLDDPATPPARRSRSMLAAAVAGDTNNPFGSFDVFVSSLQTPTGKLHDAILSLIPGADQLGDSRQERIAGLTRRLPELECYRWLRDLGAYQDALRALKKVGKTKGGMFASDVAEFALLSVLIHPLSIFKLAEETPSVMAKPTRTDVAAALEAAQLLESFFATHGALYAAGGIDVAAVLGLHKITSALRAMLEAAHKAPGDKESARQILYLDMLTVGMHQKFGDCNVPVLLALAAIVGYHPDSSNLYARVKKIKEAG